MADCLTPAEIEDLAAGKLAPADQARAQAHLAECEKCRESANVRQNDDQFFGDIKRAYQAETVAEDAPPVAILPGQAASDSIEGYEILREIHRGGQGVVYKAVQKATKRTIALKVLLQGPYASAKQRHRFEREIDLVASLQHPNIVTIYDSGITRDQRHFFAMEYIHGQPLDVYLSDKNLSIDDTLRLFQKVCAAVNHAHQRGVIHRDLKPNNILVDANGEPHVLDFGLAKAAGANLAEGIPVTVTGEFMGTLAYASPEQTKGDPNLIDIRTDVYSLGVILYEMLTSKYPYEVIGQMADVLKNIAETEPRKPSTIRRQINDEVETIVLKALAKEKGRRYQSAEALTVDIEHYLSGEPIDAKRDSGWYMLKKGLRRYRIPVAVAMGFAIVVSSSLIVTLRLWTEAKRAQIAETAAKKEALSERDRAVEAEQSARRQTYTAKIASASGALSLGQLDAVHRHLSAAPREFRNWEWDYLGAEANRLLDGIIFRGAFGSDGTILASGGSWEFNYLPVEANLLGTVLTLRAHDITADAVAFGPDGTILASGGSDEFVRIWETRTGIAIATLGAHEGSVTAVAFSPVGGLFASAAEDSTIRIWDATAWKQVATLLGHEDTVSAIAFSPDGTLLASTAEDFTVRLWDISTYEERTMLHAAGDYFTAIAFSPDGTRLALGSGDGTVSVRDSSTGDELLRLTENNEAVTSVDFSRDGSRLASGCDDHTIRIWDTAGGQLLHELWGHTAEVSAVVFGLDSGLLVSGSHDGTVRLWDSTTGKVLGLIHGHNEEVTSVAFSPDGEHIAFASRDGTVRICSESNSDLQNLVKAVAFDSDGRRLAAVLEDPSGIYHRSTLTLWDFAAHKKLAVLANSLLDANSLCFSADGRRLAAKCWATLHIWDVLSGEELAVIDDRSSPEANILAFNHDGSRLVSGSDSRIRVWDSSTGAELFDLSGHQGRVTSLALSRDGSRLASGSVDKTIRLWDFATGQEVLLLDGHNGTVRSIAFSPNGLYLASGSDRIARVWDAERGVLLHELSGHNSSVSSITFSPDGERLATGASDGSILLWDWSSGEELLLLGGRGRLVTTLDFSPDSSLLVAGGRNGILVYDALSRDLRYQAAQAVQAVDRKAGAIVAALWEQWGDAHDVNRALREDTSLTESFRQAALNHLLLLATQTRSEANTIVDDYWERLGDWNSVAQHFEEDASISEPVRREGLSIVSTRSEALLIVDILWAQLGSADRVREYLKEDDSLDGRVRRAALEELSRRRSHPSSSRDHPR